MQRTVLGLGTIQMIPTLPKPVSKCSCLILHVLHWITIVDWTLLTAGSVYNTTSGAGRDALINKAAARPFFKNIQNKPNPSTYAADFGTTISGISSPALGASFALLALK